MALVSKICTVLLSTLITASHAQGIVGDPTYYPTPSASPITLAGSVSGPTAISTQSSPSCPSSDRILKSVVIASVVVAACFLAEIVAILVFVNRRKKEQRRPDEKWTPSLLDQFPDQRQSLRGPNYSIRDSKAQSITSLDADSSKQLPDTPVSTAYEFEPSVLTDIAIEQPSPPLRPTFPATPSSVFETPLPSSNIYSAGRQTWIAGSGLNRLTVVSLPSQYAESTRSKNSRHSKARSTSVAQETTDGRGQENETLADLRVQIREFETQQKVLVLQNASGYRPPSYESN
ncbi:hypothetical protein DFH07DRAFT_1059803 [Mycena maculata]|uniref:Transmembrane protein n=1 Tax=Mycena maculata TaxID=230809 RepID=A0AAD7JC58_9AGAR|nr:hypothetical protein DFH07DRAFT_1059803 [Mycena maculata]